MWEMALQIQINKQGWSKLRGSEPFKSISAQSRELPLKLLHGWYLMPRRVAFMKPGTVPLCWWGVPAVWHLPPHVAQMHEDPNVLGV